jgi:flagellar biosynthesis protein FlhF
MRIKTFEAATLQDALSLAKQELGEDAVVLNTRHVKANSLLGLRAGTKVEVTAAVDESVLVAAGGQTAGVGGQGPAAWGQAPQAMPQTDRSGFAIPDVRNGARPGFVIPNIQGADRPASAAPSVHSPAFDPRPAPPAAPVSAFSDSRPQAPAPQAIEILELRSELSRLTAVVQGLIKSGLSVAPCAPLTSQLGIDEDLLRGELADLAGISDPESLIAAITAKLAPFAMPPDISQSRIIALVGPTGVGKTTTLAKMAARFALEQGKKVALVTADTFRIGAVEQLRTYARIMGLPLEIALSPDDVAAGVEKHSDKDVVLIDTVGRSQRSRTHLQELKGFLDAAEGVQTHLVVSATLSRDIQREVVDAFSMFSPERLVITKLDESPIRGSILNLPLRTGLGISCTTAGQNVPQDIDFADAGKLAKMVVDTTVASTLEVAA